MYLIRFSCSLSNWAFFLANIINIIIISCPISLWLCQVDNSTFFFLVLSFFFFFQVLRHLRFFFDLNCKSCVHVNFPYSFLHALNGVNR